MNPDDESQREARSAVPSRASSRAGSRQPFRYKDDIAAELEETKAELARQKAYQDAVAERALAEAREARQQLADRNAKLDEREKELMSMQGAMETMQDQLEELQQSLHPAASDVKKDTPAVDPSASAAGGSKDGTIETLDDQGSAEVKPEQTLGAPVDPSSGPKVPSPKAAVLPPGVQPPAPNPYQAPPAYAPVQQVQPPPLFQPFGPQTLPPPAPDPNAQLLAELMGKMAKQQEMMIEIMASVKNDAGGMAKVVEENSKQIELARVQAEQRDFKRERQSVDLKVPPLPSLLGKRNAYLRVVTFRNDLKQNAGIAVSKEVDFCGKKVPAGEAYVDFEFNEAFEQYLKNANHLSNGRYDSIGNMARRKQAISDKSNLVDVDGFVINEFIAAIGETKFHEYLGEKTDSLDESPYLNGTRTLGYVFYRMLCQMHDGCAPTGPWTKSIEGWTFSDEAKLDARVFVNDLKQLVELLKWANHIKCALDVRIIAKVIESFLSERHKATAEWFEDPSENHIWFLGAMKVMHTGFSGAKGGPSHYLEATEVDKLLERTAEIIKDINRHRLMPSAPQPKKPKDDGQKDEQERSRATGERYTRNARPPRPPPPDGDVPPQRDAKPKFACVFYRSPDGCTNPNCKFEHREADHREGCCVKCNTKHEGDCPEFKRRQIPSDPNMPKAPGAGGTRRGGRYGGPGGGSTLSRVVKILAVSLARAIVDPTIASSFAKGVQQIAPTEFSGIVAPSVAASIGIQTEEEAASLATSLIPAVSCISTQTVDEFLGTPASVRAAQEKTRKPAKCMSSSMLVCHSIRRSSSQRQHRSSRFQTSRRFTESMIIFCRLLNYRELLVTDGRLAKAMVSSILAVSRSFARRTRRVIRLLIMSSSSASMIVRVTPTAPLKAN